MFLQENVQLDPAGMGSAAAGSLILGSSGSTCKPAELRLCTPRGELRALGLLSLLEGSGRINEFTVQECSQETTTRESEQLQTWKVCEAQSRAPCGETKKKREVRMTRRRKTSGISDASPLRALKAAASSGERGISWWHQCQAGAGLAPPALPWYP